MTSIYDNPSFFSAYAQMERSKKGLSAAGEWHQLLPLFPDVTEKTVLDLGCGYGWHCRYAAKMGAKTVLGIDSSQRMIQQAMLQTEEKTVTYRVCGIEEYHYPLDTFDLVISNLALHYIRDLNAVYANLFRTLKKGGYFLFNIEHPVFTAGIHQDWIYDSHGKPLYWPVDRYFSPGKRNTLFLDHIVEKQHHTLTQILNGLLQNGFSLQAVEEVTPPEEWLSIPGMEDELRRPMMLLVKAVKTDGQ